MKGERKLRLVKGGADAPPDDPPPTAEELAEAEALREALADGHDPLAAALSAAHAPRALAEADLDAILGRALGDEAAATAIERAAAERLRNDVGPDAELARALRAAMRPGELPAARNEALLEKALAAPLRPRFATVRRIAPVTMAALASVAAIAAGLALFVGRGPAPGGERAATAAAHPELARARSADGLFDAATPFPRTGQESARVDRIATARASDLRNNRFAAWGVR